MRLDVLLLLYLFNMFQPEVCDTRSSSTLPTLLKIKLHCVGHTGLQNNFVHLPQLTAERNFSAHLPMVSEWSHMPSLREIMLNRAKEPAKARSGGLLKLREQRSFSLFFPL